MADRKIEYVIFDMDGLLLDSEKIYTQVTNEILAPYGVEMTWDIKSGCMGKPEHKAAKHLLSFFPGISLTLPDYLVQRNALQDELWPSVPLLPGAEKLIRHLHAHGIPIAVATGSRRRNYELKTGRLRDVFDLFEGRVICGDDDVGGRDGKRKLVGKPDPDIFLAAARQELHRPVGYGYYSECSQSELADRAKGLVFEDAIPGMQAGKRAGMNVVWVPDANLLDVEYTGSERADAVLRSLEEFKPEDWGLPPTQK
ncbi:hypothetical protein PLICRDRAFT_50923 [Plicaturopsis crispa FD-325 SS-3]|nr:hypothetical protein PLICRDRAFT_50923 [Plicaturopsis crispa FD-325 SS-3]